MKGLLYFLIPLLLLCTLLASARGKTEDFDFELLFEGISTVDTEVEHIYDEISNLIASFGSLNYKRFVSVVDPNVTSSGNIIDIVKGFFTFVVNFVVNYIPWAVELTFLEVQLVYRLGQLVVTELGFVLSLINVFFKFIF